MRILMWHEDTRGPGEGGGAESMLRDLTQALRQRGHEVAWLQSRGIMAAIDDFNPDIVQVMTLHNFIGIDELPVLQASNTPHLWAIMDYWPFCKPRMLLVDNDKSCPAVNGRCGNECGQNMDMGGVLATVNNSPVVALNRFTADIYRRNGMRVDFTIELGIDTELFKPDHTKRDKEISIYTSTAWASQPVKGMHILQRALSGTPYEANLITGLPRERVAEALQRAHIYVFPSCYEETFGLCLAEALASGCACIASDVAGARAQIDHRVTGLLVPPRDPMALRGAIEYMIDNPSHRESMAYVAYTHSQKHHTLEVMARNWERAYQEVIDGKSRNS